MGLWDDVCDFVGDACEAAYDNVIRPTANAVTFGALDRSKAADIRASAEWRQERAKEELEEQKKTTQESLENLGTAKQDAYANGLTEFTKLYSRIGKVDLKPIRCAESGIDYKRFKIEYKEISTTAVALTTKLAAAGGGLVAGAALASAAYGVATIATTATFGTLSGVAASNATLAWLGGGSLASGGAGVAGGMVVLGGVALAPLLVAGIWYGVSKGKQQLNEAYNFSDEVDVVVEKIRSIVLELQKVTKGADLFRDVILSMSGLMDYENGKLERIVHRLDERGLWRKFIVDPVKRILNMQVLTAEEASDFRDAVNCASLLKKIIDKPLLNEEGAFMQDAIEMLNEHTGKCNALLQRAAMPLLANA